MGRIKFCTPSDRPSVSLSVRPVWPCLRFSRNKKTVETSNSVEVQRWTMVSRGPGGRQILGLNVKGHGQWKDNVKNRFL